MKYLIYDTEPEACERSLQEALRRGASPSTVTRYWWSWRETTGNQWALCVPDSDVNSLTEHERLALIDVLDYRALLNNDNLA